MLNRYMKGTMAAMQAVDVTSVDVPAAINIATKSVIPSSCANEFLEVIRSEKIIAFIVILLSK